MKPPMNADKIKIQNNRPARKLAEAGYFRGLLKFSLFISLFLGIHRRLSAFIGG